MKRELLDLYNEALAAGDEVTIRHYQQSKERIAPQIVIDLILENKDLEENTRASDEVIRGLVVELEIIKKTFDWYRAVRGGDGVLKPAVEATEKAIIKINEYLKSNDLQ